MLGVIPGLCEHHHLKRRAVTPQKPLAGRTVWLWPDNDDPGRKYADKVAELLKKAGASHVCELHLDEFRRDPAAVGMYRYEILPDGYDAANAVIDGWTAEAINQLRQDPGFFQLPRKDAEAETEAHLSRHRTP